jgi:hypothetical protein
VISDHSFNVSEVSEEIIKESINKLKDFLGVEVPRPKIVRISLEGSGMYQSGVVFLGVFYNKIDEERILIHELTHHIQNVYCKPKFPWLESILEGVLLAIGIDGGKLLRFLMFEEGFATWVEESIMGERGLSYWLSLPSYYRKVYLAGKRIFEGLTREEAIKVGLKCSKFCRNRSKKGINHMNNICLSY